MPPALIQLPAEILDAIFFHLDPASLISVSQTCQFVKKITIDAPILWRHFCKTRYKAWAPHHDIATKLAGPLSEVDWRVLFIQRINAERDTLRLFNRLLETQQGRIQHINEIAELGYDVKETLLDQVACPDDAEDVLARRYYATATLQRIQKEMAINVWKDLQNGEDVPIETALGAYDLFTRSGEDVDLETISEKLDQIAKGVLEQYPDFKDLNARLKASTLAGYLREQGFQGVSDASYRALRNSFIGIVLSSSTHQSLPLISVAIYCSVAKRLGLDARPCGFLFHVYTLIYAPKDYTLDGQYKPTNSDDTEFMYLDPFRSSDEVHQSDLRRVLREMGVSTAEHEHFLTATNAREMVLRTARNIMNSVQTIRQAEAGVAGVHAMHGINSSWTNAYPDMDNSFYATVWASFMLSPEEVDESASVPSTSIPRRQYLPYLLEHFQNHYPWDITLLERFVFPMFYDHPEGEALVEFVNVEHTSDRLPKVAKQRTARTLDVKFKVGQLFRHKRYHYEGVITGWDINCAQREDWIQHMGVDRLPHGRDQSFYHAL
jgi:F-box protein 21